jgi:hypothetical protein
MSSYDGMPLTGPGKLGSCDSIDWSTDRTRACYLRWLVKWCGGNPAALGSMRVEEVGMSQLFYYVTFSSYLRLLSLAFFSSMSFNFLICIPLINLSV